MLSFHIITLTLPYVRGLSVVLACYKWGWWGFTFIFDEIQNRVITKNKKRQDESINALQLLWTWEDFVHSASSQSTKEQPVRSQFYFWFWCCLPFHGRLIYILHKGTTKWTSAEKKRKEKKRKEKKRKEKKRKEKKKKRKEMKNKHETIQKTRYESNDRWEKINAMRWG